MLAQELTRRRRQQTDVQVRPLHLDALADPAGRRGVVRGLDFHAAVEMDGAPPEAVVPKRLDGQGPEHRPFLGKHRSHLPLRGAVDARVGPVRLPAIQMGLRLLQALEAQSVQRRALRVANARFDFAFAIRIAHATWEADDPIVREHVAIDGIERRVVDVRREHAFFEIVEDDEARRAAQPAKRPLVELGPRLRARVPDEQAHRFARVAERQDEEPHASVLGRLRMTDHRAVAVVDLRFFTRCRRDDDARFDGRAAAQLADEATDAGVASGDTLLHEVLPDRHRVAPQFQGCFDLLAVRRTPARRRRATRRRVGGHLRLGNCRFCGWVGGHLPGNGRFCRPFARAATAPHRQPRPSQVPRGRFAADVGRVRDPADGPTQTAQGQNLLLLLVVQDVAHPDEGLQSHRPRQRLGRRQLIAGFEVSINCRFWVSTEACRRRGGHGQPAGPS